MNNTYTGLDPSATAPLSRLSYIELDRYEGQLAFWRATTFAGANRVLRDWAQTAPVSGGYDKVAVHIVWDSGVAHAYRLDLKHPSFGEEPDVEQDLQHTVGFALGLITNPNWSDEQHARVLARYERQGVVAMARRISEECMLGDVEPPQAVVHAQRRLPPAIPPTAAAAGAALPSREQSPGGGGVGTE